jgi:hypothetical protein
MVETSKYAHTTDVQTHMYKSVALTKSRSLNYSTLKIDRPGEAAMIP